MVRLVRRMHNAFTLLEYFASHQWNLPSNNLTALNKSLNETDRKMFDFDVSQIDWVNYTYNMYIGMRRHLLKEEDDNVEKARKRFSRSVYRNQHDLLIIKGHSLTPTFSQLNANSFFFFYRSQA
jgi:hypothetical protein